VRTRGSQPWGCSAVCAPVGTRSHSCTRQQRPNHQTHLQRLSMQQQLLAPILEPKTQPTQAQASWRSFCPVPSSSPLQIHDVSCCSHIIPSRHSQEMETSATLCQLKPPLSNACTQTRLWCQSPDLTHIKKNEKIYKKLKNLINATSPTKSPNSRVSQRSCPCTKSPGPA
jgi:hypothetical protein